MIQHIKNFFCKLFGIKQCACPEDDEHIEYYTKVPEPDVPVYTENPIDKPKHCSGHKRFRKTCPLCLEIVK